MPIPFAEITSESTGLHNLQLYFWRNAVENFDRMLCEIEGYKSEDCDFCTDACITLVLAGTSVSQLLGQQWRDGFLKHGEETSKSRVPQMLDLFDRLSQRATDNEINGISILSLKTTFNEFVKIFNAIRHFGEPKHDEVRSLNYDSLCRYMNALRDVWHIVAALRPNPTCLTDDFSRSFSFAQPWEVD